MQNKYVGDIGDFGKYGLLRFISGRPLRLGVVWYLHPHESKTSDGKFIGYLCNRLDNDSRFRDCDPHLYETLRQLVYGGDRNVAAVRRNGVLLQGTTFYEELLPNASGGYQAKRESWLEGALQATAGADLVFFDPDNGISEAADRVGKRSRKHVFIQELRPFWERGQSLIIYHHLNRNAKAPEQIGGWAEILESRLKPSRLWSLWYHRGTARAYFIAAQKRHEPTLEARLKRFSKSPWREHFTKCADYGPAARSI